MESNRFCHWVAAMFALVGGPLPLLAQAATILVLDSATATPVPGAAAIAMGSSPRPLDRRVSDASGMIRADHDAWQGVTRVRLLRLGFRPHELAWPAATSDTVRVRLVRLPSLLAPIVSRANARCPRVRDADALFGLWQQVGAGLLSVAAARQSLSGRLIVGRYESIASRTGRVISRHVQLDTVSDAIAFAAAGSAEDFVRWGFARDTGQFRVYYGPDAEVIADPAFRELYCFSFAKPSTHRPNQVGVSFRPARRDSGRVDIEGSVWVDTLRRALVDLDFRHSVAPVQGVHSEGSVLFQSTPQGHTQIERWALRGPRWRVDTVRAPVPAGFYLRRALQIGETGAEVARASWSDGRAWEGHLGSVRIRLADSAGAPVARRFVYLQSSGYSGHTDSAGALTFHHVLPGAYRASIADSMLASLGVLTDSPVDVVARRDSVVELRRVVRTEWDLMRQICRGHAGDWRFRPVIVKAVRPGGAPAASVAWELSGLTGVSNAAGFILTCAMPVGPQSYLLKVWSGHFPHGQHATEAVLELRPGALTITRVEVSEPER